MTWQELSEDTAVVEIDPYHAVIRDAGKISSKRAKAGMIHNDITGDPDRINRDTVQVPILGCRRRKRKIK